MLLLSGANVLGGSKSLIFHQLESYLPEFYFFIFFNWSIVIYTIIKVVHAQLLSHVQPYAIPWTVAHQDPLSIEFSRQEYCSGLPFPLPGDLPNPGIKLMSPALAGGFFTALMSSFEFTNIGQVPTQSQGLWKACGMSLTWWERWLNPPEGGIWVWVPQEKGLQSVVSSELPSYWQRHLVVNELDLTGPSAYLIPPWVSTLFISALHSSIWWELRPFSPHRALTWTVNLYNFFLESRAHHEWELGPHGLLCWVSCSPQSPPQSSPFQR